MADTVFIDGQGFSVAKEKQADFVASKTFKSSRRRRSSSGGGGKSTPQTPTPSADKLVGSSADREAQIAAFRSGGQAAFNQKVAETKTRIQQAEIAQQKQQLQQARQNQERKRVVTSLKRLERGEITQFQFKTEQGTVTVRDRGEAAEIRQSIEDEGEGERIETVREERIEQKKLKPQVNKSQVPTGTEKQLPIVNPRSVRRSSQKLVDLGFKAFGYEIISASEKQQLISQELKPLRESKTPKQQQIEIGKLQAKGINVTSTKQGYNIDTSKIVPTSKGLTIARDFISDTLLFAAFSPALATTAQIGSKGTSIVKVTKTPPTQTKFIARVRDVPDTLQVNLKTNKVTDLSKVNKVVEVIARTKGGKQQPIVTASKQFVKNSGASSKDIGSGLSKQNLATGVSKEITFITAGKTKQVGQGIKFVTTGGKNLKITTPVDKGKGILSNAGSRIVKAEKKTAGLEVPTSKVIYKTESIKNIPTESRARLGGIIKRKKGNTFTFEGGEINKMRIYKSGRITYLADTNVKGIIQNVKPSNKLNLGTGGGGKPSTSKTTSTLSKNTEKSIVEQVASIKSLESTSLKTPSTKFVVNEKPLSASTTSTSLSSVKVSNTPTYSVSSERESNSIGTVQTSSTSTTSLSSIKLLGVGSSKKSRELSLVRQANTSKLATSNKQDTILGSLSSFRTATVTKGKLKTVSTNFPYPPRTPPTIVPRVPKTPILFGLPRPPKRLQQSRQGTFNVAVRRYGKFRTIGTGLGLSRAIGLGRGRTSSTLAATFRITPSSGGTFGGGLTTPKGFKKKKDKRGTLFIEQPSLRLSTGKEVSQIQTARVKGGLI